MFLADEDMGLGNEKLLEDQLFLAENLRQGLSVTTRQVKDADFAAMTRDVIDDLACHGFAKREVVAVLRAAELAYDIHERLDGERVVLGRNGELGQAHGLARVLGLDRGGVREDLPRRGKELLALARHGDAAGGAREDCDPEFLLEGPDRFREGRLRDEHAA